MCTSSVKEGVSSAQDRMRQYKREKADQFSKEMQESNISGKAMEQFEAGVDTSTQGARIIGEEAQRWGDTAAMIMGVQKPSAPGTDSSDTTSANYSKSSSEKSSKSDKKAKKTGNEGTGGSKKQFYASKNK
jgi:hypothetical protein